MARRHAVALAFKSWGAAKHTTNLAAERGRGLQPLPQFSVLVAASAGSSSAEQSASSDQEPHGRSSRTGHEVCRTGAAVSQQESLSRTFAHGGSYSARFGAATVAHRHSGIPEEVPCAGSSSGWRSIHFSRVAAADESSRSREGAAQPLQEGDQKRKALGTEGEAQPAQEAEPKAESQAFTRQATVSNHGVDAGGSSAAELPRQGNESWPEQGSADGAALNSMAVLEEMLRELEGTRRGHGVGAAEDDQFLASLRLRLAQEYAAHNIKMQEAESLAFKACQFFREKGAKDDIAGAIGLHVVGICQARLQLVWMFFECRRGEMASAYNILQSALAASHACANAARPAVPGQKRRGPKKGGRPSSPMQPHSSVSQLLLQEEEEAVPPAAEQHKDSRYVAQSLEFSCHMLMGEIRSQNGEPSDAATHYRAAVELVEKNRALHPASVRRDAYHQLVDALSKAQCYREALAYAQRCPLGEPSETPAEMPMAPGDDTRGEVGEEESRLAEAYDLMQEKRLLASVYMGLGDIGRAVAMSKGVREVLAGVGAPALDLAAADVATAELLLVGSEREESVVLESEAEGEPPVGAAQESGGSEEGPVGALRKIEELQEEALELLTRALRTQQSELGPVHPVLAPTTVAAAEACVQLGKTEEAQAFASQALGLLDSAEASGPDSLEHAPELMGQLANIVASLGESEQGVALLRRAEGLLLAEGRKGDALGMLVEFAGDLIPHAQFQLALSLLSRAEAEYGDTLPGERGWHLELLHAKGCALSSEGQHDDALDSLEEARTLLQETEETEELGEISMRIHFSRAAAYYRARKLDDALVAQEQLLSLVQEQEGEGSPLYLSELDKLEKLQAEVKSSSA